MYEVSFSDQYLKDYKLCLRRKIDISLLDAVLISLAENGSVPLKHKPHILSGKLNGLWECHIKPDWLLIWEKDEKEKKITLLGTGTHSDLFK
jgi:mRNA interferase YafQ